MIALAITRRPVDSLDSFGPTRHLRVDGWWITVLATGVLAEIEQVRTDLAVRERVPSPSEPRVVLLEGVVTPDRREVRLFRPGVGGRAFFHARTPDGGFAGATHIRLLRCLGIPIAEDPGALPELFAYGFVTPPASIYCGISDIPIGATLRARIAGHELEIEQSSGCDWLERLDARGSQVAGDAAAQEVAARLSDFVGGLADSGTHLVSLLSGGLDSSVLARVAVTSLAGRRSISTGFPFEDSAYNGEREYALTAAEALLTDHRYIEPSLGEYLDGLLTATATHEQPVYGLQTVLLGLLFAREAPPGGTALLCGEGADGLFGGPTHLRFFSGRRWERLSDAVAHTPGLGRLLGVSARWSWRAERLQDELHEARRRQRPVSDPEHPLWEHGLDGNVPWILRHFGASREAVVRSGWAALEPFARRNVLDLVSIRALLGNVHILESMWSKLAEAGGWAMVYPFTDEVLMAVALRARWEDKLAAPKQVLRMAARNLGVPEFVIARPKLHFSVDPHRWALRGGPLEPLVSLATSVVPEKTLRELQRPEYSIAQLYWRALAYAIWKRLVLAEEPIARLRDELAEAVARESGRPA